VDAGVVDVVAGAGDALGPVVDLAAVGAAVLDGADALVLVGGVVASVADVADGGRVVVPVDLFGGPARSARTLLIAV
jgi:hypothetical protein